MTSNLLGILLSLLIAASTIPVMSQEHGSVAERIDWLSYFDEDGLALYRDRGKLGMLDRKMRVVIPPIFDKLGRFEGRPKVKGTLKGDSVWIDRSGKVIARQDECPDGRNVVRRDGKLQIVDRNAKPIHDAFFEWIKFVCDKPSMVQLAGQKKLGFIDASGRLLTNQYFDNVSEFYKGIAGVTIGGKWGVIDESGTFLLEPTKSVVGQWISGVGEITLELEDGDVSLDKAKVAELARNPGILTVRRTPRFKCRDGSFAWSRNGKWGFANKNGTFFIKPRFDAVGCFHNEVAPAAIPERREWCQIDKKGQVIPDRPCSCRQPVVIVELWQPDPKKDCYQEGLDIVRGVPGRH